MGDNNLYKADIRDVFPLGPRISFCDECCLKYNCFRNLRCGERYFPIPVTGLDKPVRRAGKLMVVDTTDKSNPSKCGCGGIVNVEKDETSIHKLNEIEDDNISAKIKFQWCAPHFDQSDHARFQNALSWQPSTKCYGIRNDHAWYTYTGIEKIPPIRYCSKSCFREATQRMLR